MIITCEKCGTRFNLDESLLDADGSPVRCSRCRNIFTAFPPPPDLEFDDFDFSDTEFEEDRDLSETGSQDTDQTETLKLETTDPDELELETTDPDEIEIEIGAEDLTDEPDLAEDLELHEKPALTEDVGEDLEFDDLDFSDIEFETGKDLSETGSQDTDETETLKLETTDPDELELETADPDEIEIEIEAENLTDKPDLSEDLELHEESALAEDVGEDLEDLHVDDLFSEEKDAEFDLPFGEEKKNLEKEENEFEGPDEFDDTDAPPDKPPHEPPPPRRPARASLIHPPDRDEALMDVEDEPRKKRSPIGVPVLVLLILFIIAAGGYVAATFLGYKIPYLPEIRIPFIQQYLPEKKSDPVSYPDPIPDQKSVTGRFITNDTAGELFIITGKIENPAQIPYRRIQVKGTLFQKEQKAAMSRTAFCGNIIPDEALRTSPIEELTIQLGTPRETAGINDKVMPGETVPFMLVFSDLPQNLENFTVEVAGFEHAAP